MQEPLYRAIARAAEQRVVLKLRTGAAIEPGQVTSELLDEFSQLLKFDEHKEALRTRLEIHVAKFVESVTQSPR